MIAERIAQLAARIGDQTALMHRGESWSYGKLASEAECLAGSLAAYRGQRVGVAISSASRQLVTLAALDRIGAIAVLYSVSSGAGVLDQSRRQLKLAKLLTDLPGLDQGSTEQSHSANHDTREPGQSDEGQIVLFTSGTSGPPKPALHSWASLAAAVRYDEHLQGACWLLTYDPAKFAGLQVILQAILTGGRIAIPDTASPTAAARCLAEQQVQFASGTPTYWRMLLYGTSREDLARASLEQITLGGEPVSQSLLDALKETFPAARITHIYASTEMGRCFSVSDGRAGFPRTYLDDDRLPCKLRIAEDGQLLIRSDQAMSGYLGEQSKNRGWFATGDLVQLHEDRVYFIGRQSDAINVGGNKVYPLEVEEVIRLVPGVHDVRVHGITSSMVGQLVAAQVQPASDVDEQSLREQILAACRVQLAKHKLPAAIRFCHRLDITEAGKIARKAD